MIIIKNQKIYLVNGLTNSGRLVVGGYYSKFTHEWQELKNVNTCMQLATIYNQVI